MARPSDKSLAARFHTLEFADKDGLTRASIVPGWGANIVSFIFWPGDLLWPISVLEVADISSTSVSPTSFGMPLLAPTPGRVGKNQSGCFNYSGRSFRIEPRRHGHARHLPWVVRNQSRSSIECAAEIRVEEADHFFPFHLFTTHKVVVSQRALRSIVRLENVGKVTMPANVGWHPYLHRPENCIVRLPARSYWELGEGPEPTPTGKVLQATGNYDFFNGRELRPGEHWDHVFTDLVSAGAETTCSITGEQTLTSKDGSRIDAMIRREVVMLRSPAADRATGMVHNVQLYTPPGRHAVSLEPLSSAPDAINLKAAGCSRTGLVELAPGEGATFEIELRIHVDK